MDEENKVIRVRYRSVDRYSESRRFKTLPGARKYAQKWVGAHPEIGIGYAVSWDGVGTVSVSGCSLRDLFPEKESTEA